MRQEFVMRGKTASGTQEVLNFSGYKPGYAYRLTEFLIFPSTDIGAQHYELAASITAAKTYEDPSNPNFNNEGLIANAMITGYGNPVYPSADFTSVVNDTFLITQNLILAAIDTYAGSPMDCNWQCRFVAEKMGDGENAVANYKQFMIYD